jgi:glycine/D-amino acid oxidase-like deaminating enzyme
VVVLGAGIVGASIAYHLSRRGAAVTLVDRSGPASGATGSSFAWVGAAGGDRGWPGGAADLRASVLGDHRRLEAELPGFAVRWTGSLTWSATTSDGPAPAAGPGQRVVGRAEIAELEPDLRALPPSAVHTPSDGGIDPVAMTTALVRAARALGARVVLDSPVTSLRRGDGRVTGVDCRVGFIPASTVVLAVGAAVGRFGTPLPVSASPALLVRAWAPPGLLSGIVVTPGWEAREVRPGRLVMTAPVTGHETPRDLTDLARGTTRALAEHVAGGDRIRFDSTRLGLRPMPADGAPLIGRPTPHDAVYVAVMHSAVTLAATVGRLVADEIIDGRPVGELANCRPHRFGTPHGPDRPATTPTTGPRA